MIFHVILFEQEMKDGRHTVAHLSERIRALSASEVCSLLFNIKSDCFVSYK